MYERFITMSGDLYGYWGVGDTIEKAKKNMKKVGGKIKNCQVIKFTSELPFAAPDKKVADDNEADCWIGKDGSTNWIRCERELMT